MRPLTELKLLAVGVFTLILLLAGSIVAYTHFSAAGRVVDAGNSFMQSLFSGDTTKAYSDTSVSAQQKTSLSKFAVQLAGYKSSTAKLFDQRAVLKLKDQSDYEADLSGLGSQTYLVHIHFVLDNGSWKVDSLNNILPLSTATKLSQTK